MPSGRDDLRRAFDKVRDTVPLARETEIRRREVAERELADSFEELRRLADATDEFLAVMRRNGSPGAVRRRKRHKMSWLPWIDGYELIWYLDRVPYTGPVGAGMSSDPHENIWVTSDGVWGASSNDWGARFADPLASVRDMAENNRPRDFAESGWDSCIREWAPGKAVRHIELLARMLARHELAP